MQPWKISVGLTAIVLALALMLAGESFAYLKPHLRIILTDYWMPVAGSGADRIVGAIRPGVRPGDAAYAAMT